MAQDPRKQVVFVGNCNAYDLANFFGGMASLADEFRFHPWSLHLNPTPTEEMMAILPNAHAMFIQNIAEAEAARDNFVPNGVTCHSFPSYLRRTYWPFDTLLFGKDELAAADAIKGGYVRFPDGLLGRLRTEVQDKYQRFNVYKDLAVTGAVPKNFVRLNEMEEDMFRHIDDVFQTKIGDYIIAHAKTEQTHHWIGHPAGAVYGLLMEYCMDKLGIKVELPAFEVLNAWSQMQVPVHPRIGEQLGLEWAKEDSTYFYGPTGLITWSDYVRMYINQLG